MAQPSRVPPAGWLSTSLPPSLSPSRQTSAPHFHLLEDFKAALGGEEGISLRSLQQDSENLSDGTAGKETQQLLASLDFFSFQGKRSPLPLPCLCPATVVAWGTPLHPLTFLKGIFSPKPPTGFQITCFPLQTHQKMGRQKEPWTWGRRLGFRAPLST